MPTDEWLCKEMGKLNMTLVEGYPSHSSEAGGLLKDQFVKPARSQAKWYGFVSDQQKSDTGTEKTVSSWNTPLRLTVLIAVLLRQQVFHQGIRRSRQGKLPPYVSRLLVSTGVCIEFKTT